jgi:hypothetical protein
VGGCLQFRRRESAECGYIGFYRWNHRRTRLVGIPVGNSDGKWVTSLYGDPDLNPSVIPSVKSSEKVPCHQTVSFFQNSIYFVSHTDHMADEIYVVGNYYRQ